MFLALPNCIDVVVIGVYLPYYGCKIASFPEELGIVEDLIIQFNSTCTVLIVGDINAHIRVNSYRSWGVSSQNGKLFNSSMNRHDMIIADLLPSTIGPNYTFNRNNCFSYVDHCVISSHSVGLVVSTEVLPESVLNVSDHLAIRISLNIKLPQTNKKQNLFQRPAWNKAKPEEIETLYTHPLDTAVQNVLLSFDINPNSILESNFSQTIRGL